MYGNKAGFFLNIKIFIKVIGNKNLKVKKK